MRASLQVGLVVTALATPAATATAQPTWNPRPSVTVPGARSYHAMAYDAGRQVTVLYGGRACGSTTLDTWEWDGVDWTARPSATTPPAASRFAMAFDTRRGVTVLYGTNETWEWDGTDWTRRVPTGGVTRPPDRTYTDITYDGGRGVVLLFGGAGQFGSRYADTWEWDGVLWRQRTPANVPPGRSNPALAYDAARDQVVLFGGNGTAANLGDTWVWDGVDWTDKSPAQGPSARTGQSLQYDAARARTVLFGGYPDLSDTWEWDGRAWAETGAAPGRYYAAMAYDTARRRVVLFGGTNCAADTWEYYQAASCQVRNGSGVNQTGYRCTTPPMLGAPWTSEVPTTAATVSTFLGLAARPAQTTFLAGELLIDLDGPALCVPGLARHTLSVPASDAFVGATLSVQGFRLDQTAAGTTLVLFNALDLVLGV